MLKGFESDQRVDFFRAVLLRCTEHAFQESASFNRGQKTAQGSILVIVMAGTMVFRDRLLDEFAENAEQQPKVDR